MPRSDLTSLVAPLSALPKGMLLLAEPANGKDFDSFAVFVSQVNALGIPLRVLASALPAGLNRNAQFDIAPFLVETPEDFSNVAIVIVGAHEIADDRLVALRRLGLQSPTGSIRSLAIGHFPTNQAEIGVKAKISYVLGQDPEILAASTDPSVKAACPIFGLDMRRGRVVQADILPRSGFAARAISGQAISGQTISGQAGGTEPDAKPVLLIVGAPLENEATVAAIQSMAVSRRMRIALLTDGKTKQAWTKAHGFGIPIYHYGEAMPAALAARADICALFSGPSTNTRTQTLVATMIASGVIMLDATKDHKHAAKQECFIGAPAEVGALGTHLVQEILPHFAAISSETRAVAEGENRTRARNLVAALSRLVEADLAAPGLDGPGADIGLTTKVPGVSLPGVRRSRRAGGADILAATESAAAESEAPARRAVFVPTNGVGLGHAQRTSLIATEIDRTKVEPVFAAFPSCMKMLQSYGFDVMPMLSRSSLHAHEHENDLVNAARLGALSRNAASLVFDGGYVFDSILRSVVDNRLRSAWIRRGLWQGTQNNAVALDREKFFDQVIVPSEAFEELNESYSRGDHLRTVGPIVQRSVLDEAGRAALRAEIAARFGRPFDKLVVTMLGGGVAADRKAQIQAICSMMDERRDTLNLLVVWPTATVEAGAFGWNNTLVVKTHHASALVAAADTYISAVGYNSFHEAMYNAVPTIFMPQMAGYMDDQRARAMAAVDRDLAAIVEPHEMLELSREISTFLDGGRALEIRAALKELALPEPGNATAARLIEEISR